MAAPMAIANWKMHLLHEEAIVLASMIISELSLRPEISLNENVVVGLAPSHPYLFPLSAALLQGSGVELVAQDCHQEEFGAFTGAVSVPQLKSAHVQRVIVGHSERRKYFHDDDTTVAAKLRAVLKGGLFPVLCVGERLEQREAGDQEKVVEAQVRAVLEGLSAAELQTVTVAYEPVWAIGTGKNATPEQAGEMHRFIQKVLSTLHDGEPLRVLYGGSVKPGNVEELVSTPGVDGALVGGASLEASSFAQIVRACAMSGAGEE